jgi:hypothetical protein
MHSASAYNINFQKLICQFVLPCPVCICITVKSLGGVQTNLLVRIICEKLALQSCFHTQSLTDLSLPLVVQHFDSSLKKKKKDKIHCVA